MSFNLAQFEFVPLCPFGGERVGVRWGNDRARCKTHLTLPPLHGRPLPLPPEGRRGYFVCALAVLILLAAPLAHADDSPEARLRAALRTATARVRELEDQNAQLQAKQAEADRNLQAATQKAAADEKELTALKQQSATDKTALKQSSARLQSDEASLSKWQASYKEAADVARTRDADAKRLDEALGQFRQRVKACEAKNGELYKIGEEVLDLYDKKDFLDIVAGEPVTKLKRVEIENTMQDYEDKMRANEIGRAAQ